MKYETAEMINRLRDMASQILSPGSEGKRFFEAVADELEGLRHGLNCRQEEEGNAHRLFHEPLENAPDIDWARLHGPDEDGPVGFVRILRKQLNIARAKIKELETTISVPSVTSCKNHDHP